MSRNKCQGLFTKSRGCRNKLHSSYTVSQVQLIPRVHARGNVLLFTIFIQPCTVLCRDTSIRCNTIYYTLRKTEGIIHNSPYKTHTQYVIYTKGITWNAIYIFPYQNAHVHVSSLYTAILCKCLHFLREGGREGVTFSVFVTAGISTR